MLRQQVVIFRKRNQRKALLKKLALLKTNGPNSCTFCHATPTFIVHSNDKQSFLCNDHVGDMITTWTNAREMNVVRL